MIKLNVIQHKRDLYYYIYRVTTILFFIYLGFLCLIVCFNPLGQSESRLFEIALYWFLLLFFTAIIKKTYYVSDVIEIDDDCIKITSKELKIRRDEVENLKIDITGYKWQPSYLIRTVVVRSGIDNTISFWHKNKRYNFNFLIKNKKELNELKAFFEE